MRTVFRCIKNKMISALADLKKPYMRGLIVFQCILCICCFQIALKYMISKTAVAGDFRRIEIPLNQRLIGENYTESYCKRNSYRTFDYVNRTGFIALDNDKVRAEIDRIHNAREMIAYKGHNCTKRMPTCLIIGAAKSGTDELRDFLRIHPDIAAPDTEIYYFSQHFHKGEAWYREQMPCAYDGQISIEKTPNYLFTPKVAERVFAFNRYMKVIILAREPVQRILSSLNYEISLNPQTNDVIPSPDLDSLLVNNRTGEVTDHQDVVVSTYHIHLSEYLRYFNRSQILVLDAAELKIDPVQCIRKVESFLELPHRVCHEMFVYVPEKQHFCLKSNGTWCYSPNRGRTVHLDIRQETRDKLQRFFRPHNDRFFKLIGQTFNW